MTGLLLICQKSDADEIFEGFEVIPLLPYDNIFSKWSHIEQVVWLVVVAKGAANILGQEGRHGMLQGMIGAGRENHLSLEQSSFEE